MIVNVTPRVSSHMVPSPKSQFTLGQYVHSQPLRAWKLELATSHKLPSPKSQVCHGCLHGNTLENEAQDLC